MKYLPKLALVSALSLVFKRTHRRYIVNPLQQMVTNLFRA